MVVIDGQKWVYPLISHRRLWNMPTLLYHPYDLLVGSFKFFSHQHRHALHQENGNSQSNSKPLSKDAWKTLNQTNALALTKVSHVKGPEMFKRLIKSLIIYKDNGTKEMERT